MPIPQLNKRYTDSWKNSRPVIKAKKYNHKKEKTNWKKVLFFKLIKLGLICLVLVVILVAWLSRDLPNPNQLINREIVQSTKIYDRTGENILYEIHGDQKRTLISLSDLPEYVKKAPIAIEDKNFYKHGGFSVWAMFRTAITNVLYNRTAGGSTLTQQFIKNAVLTPEKKITRKIKELVLAYRLEQKFSKDEILQMYLNEIPYGSNAYGIEAASQKYFGKHAKDINLQEAATLAALTQSPSRYSPYGPNKDILLSRKDYVLTLMQEQGYISEEEAKIAKETPIEFREPDNNMTSPHFVMYIKDILAEKYGEKMIEQEGLKIYTTLDLYKQKIAEEVIKEKTENYQEKYGANNAALVSIDPKTGQILAMVGSRDYFDDSIDGQVNIATRLRQPGSSMKPIVYAASFIKGYTPNTILYDVVTNFSTDPANPYEPHNYNGQELGPVTIRKALAGSLNIPAVKTIYLTGVNNVIDLAETMGYSTLYPRNRFGLALVLGGAEVKLLEHVNAYSAFARDGQISPIVSILKVEDKDGKILEEYKPESKKVLESQIARMINSVLSDNEARSYIFGEKNYLNLGERPVGAKTGTTNDYHDAWTIGYTPSLATGVWVGNSNNDKMKGAADGSVVAAPIWHDYMSKVLGNTPIESFKEPDDYTTGKPVLDGQIPSQIIKIDSTTGLPASENTPLELTAEKLIPSTHSILYYVDKDNPKEDFPKNPEQDPQFQIWEEAIKKWAIKNNILSTSSLPLDYEKLHALENLPSIKILSPLLNQTINNPSLEIQTESSSLRGVKRIEYFLNGNLFETKWEQNKVFSKDISFLNNGYHSLTAKACDDVDNCTESSVDFNLTIKNNPVNGNKNSISLIKPNNGTAFNAIDFPIKIRFQIEKPLRTAKINVFIKNSEGKIELIKVIDKPQTNTQNIEWSPNNKIKGTFSLYGELRDWSGDIIKSNDLNFSIN